MSFKSPEWENDTIANKACTDLFNKKKRTSKKSKTKEKNNVNIQVNRIHPSKIKSKVSLTQVPQKHKIMQQKQKSTIKKISKIKLLSSDTSDIANRKPTRKVKKVANNASKNTIVQTTEKSPSKITKKLKRLDNNKIDDTFKTVNKETKTNKSTGLNIANLKKQLAISLQAGQVKEVSTNSLRERMLDKLKASRFRYLNEQIYTTEGEEAQKLFQSDPDAFEAYHEGYRQQVSKWPLNPLDNIIQAIEKMPKDHVVADFGCGDGRLSRSVQLKVHSFDLVSTNENIVACDMSKVPLRNCSVNVVVFCLSLMGTNLKDYLVEANRVLKIGGILKIAEVESRFESVDIFIQGLQKFGFKSTWKDLSHNLFYFLDFTKERNIKHKNKLPYISLQPCLYKKR